MPKVKIIYADLYYDVVEQFLTRFQYNSGVEPVQFRDPRRRTCHRLHEEANDLHRCDGVPHFLQS